MKHITAELEEKIRTQFAFVERQVSIGLTRRLQVADQTGNEMAPMSTNELEANGWKRALNWVLEEAGCK